MDSLCGPLCCFDSLPVISHALVGAALPQSGKSASLELRTEEAVRRL